nr:hypothetical protein [Tanacetum cinerariifolium]
LKVYEAEVQKKSNSNSQNMAFISSSKNSNENKNGNTACVSTSSTTIPTASASVATISQDTARRKENYRQGSKAKEKTPKALMAIDGVGWDWSYMENEGEDHALVADAEAPTEFALMANTESKKDLSWTGLPEFVDDTVTDYSRPSSTV